jgi:surfeit locus 1 family protein
VGYNQSIPAIPAAYTHLKTGNEIPMRVGGWQFTPGLWPTLLTLVLLPLFVRLGFWQLDRADQKEQHYEQFVQRQSEPAFDLNNQDRLRSDKAELLWRNTSVRGRYANEHIVLDNQVVNELPGYFVFTPFQLSGSDKWALVNRGWIPVRDDRSKLPDITVPTEEAQISGVISDAPATGLVLGNAPIETMSASVYRVQRIDFSKLAGLVKHDLLPFTILLAPGVENGYVREWRVPGSGREKNLGYAFQWFAFATVLVVVYAAVNLKRTHQKD